MVVCDDVGWQANNEPYNFLSEEPVLDWISNFEIPADVAAAYKKLASGVIYLASNDHR